MCNVGNFFSLNQFKILNQYILHNNNNYNDNIVNGKYIRQISVVRQFNNNIF